MELMPRFLGYVGILILIVFLLVSTGCVTMAKQMFVEKEPGPVLISQPAVYQEMIPVQEPEPVPQVAFIEWTEPPELAMYRTGGRYLGQNYGWYREDVSGLKDMRVNITVYDWKIMYGYQWWSVSWGKYFYQVPWYGEKYLFIFVYQVMEGEDQSWDPRMWGMDAGHFYVQYKDRIIEPDMDHQVGLRIRQLENTATRNDDGYVYDYGYVRGYGWNKSEMAIEQGYLRMGKSNAWDGYILYAIPVEARVEDLKVLGRFEGFGDAWWTLIRQPV